MTTRVDISANRRHKDWSRKELLGRVCWALFTPVFRFSPRPFWRFRASLLRLFGAKIGDDVHIHPTARIIIPWNLRIDDQAAVGDRAILYALGSIRIGARATISQNAHLCAGSHDRRAAHRPVIRPPIEIGDDAWICADAFVGPGVCIGNGATLAARAVAFENLPAERTGLGNPMQIR